MMLTQNTRVINMIFGTIMLLFVMPNIQNKLEFLSSSTLNLIVFSFVEVLVVVLFLYMSNILGVLSCIFRMKEFTIHKIKKELKEQFFDLNKTEFLLLLIILTINTIFFFIINKWVIPMLPMSIDLVTDLVDRLASRF